MSRYRELISDTIVFAVGSLGSKIITFFLVPLYTTALTTAEYGTTDLVTTISSLIVPLISVVIYDAVLRFGLSKNTDRKQILTNAMLVLLVGSVLGAALCPLLRLYSAVSEWVIYIALISIFTMYNNTLFAYLKIERKNIQYAVLSILYTAVLAGLNILLIVVFPMRVKGFLLSNVLALVLITSLLFAVSGAWKDIRKKYLSIPLLCAMIKYSLPLVLNSVLWWVISGSSKIMLEHFTSVSELGLYAAAAKIPALQSIVISVFQQSWTISAISEYEGDANKKYFSNIFRYYILLIALMSIVILCILKDFMKIYVGESFYAAWKYVPILLLGNFFYSISVYFGSVYSALKKNRQVAITTLVCAICAVTCGLIMVPHLGTVGAVLSVAVAYFVIGFYRLFDTRRYFPFEIDWGKLILTSIIVTGLAVCVMLDYYSYALSAVAAFLIMLVYHGEIAEMAKKITHRGG